MKSAAQRDDMTAAPGQLEVDVGLVAERVPAEDEDGAVEAELALAPGEPDWIAPDIPGSVQDAGGPHGDREGTRRCGRSRGERSPPSRGDADLLRSSPMSDPGAGTARTFSDKWERNPDLAFEQTLDDGAEISRWILSRNGWDTGDGLAHYLAGKRRVLDAGCGNGRVTALLQRYAAEDSEIIGVDVAAAEVARENLADLPNVTIRQGDLLGDLSDLGRFDFIYCQEVLHHTTDPRAGFENLASLLSPGGEIAIYVYRRKAPVREFTDDYFRDRISRLPYDDAMEICRKVAELGRALSELNVTVRVPAIEPLEIDAGQYDVQRLVYHFFMKCFWSDELDLEGNAAINYDWYHPQLCLRHTPDEVRVWFAEGGLEIVHEHVDHYGITIRGARRDGA